MPEPMMACACGGGSGGGGSGSTSSDTLVEMVENETESLNTSNTSAVEDSTVSIRDNVTENLSAFRDDLQTSSNRSEVIRTAYDEAFRNQTLAGTRTNLTEAYGPDRLVKSTEALHEEVGDPLTAEEKLDLEDQAALLPSDVKTAGAVLNYATIDALHYTWKALDNIDTDAANATVENQTLLSMLHRRMQFTTQDGNLTLEYSENTTETLRAAVNTTRSVDGQAFVQGLDVLAQAVDEVAGMDLPTEITGEQSNLECSPAEDLVYVSPTCTIIIGPTTGTNYKKMQAGPGGKYEMNVVLLELGGEDRYKHRAGGGHGQYLCDACGVPVQVNVDVGAEGDNYGRLTPDVPTGPVHGSGEFGVGFLYDGGGNDRYKATHSGLGSGEGIVAQGSAGTTGAGALFDQSGNDIYVTKQRSTPAVSSAQGAGLVEAFGLLRDATGKDQYYFNLTESGADGGGAQGFATGGSSVGMLLDAGTGSDLYTGTQDYLQGAASNGGYAYLGDRAGHNTFEVRALHGCATYRDDRCQGKRPIAGWSQGYADTTAYGVLYSGPGNDTYRIAEKANTSDRQDEGRALLGSGNTTAAGLAVDPTGDDTYEALNRSHGYGNQGLGVFSDGDGADRYSCDDFDRVSCYGVGHGGTGVFADLGTGNDNYETWDDRGDIWARGDLGMGVR